MTSKSLDCTNHWNPALLGLTDIWKVVIVNKNKFFIFQLYLNQRDVMGVQAEA